MQYLNIQLLEVDIFHVLLALRSDTWSTVSDKVYISLVLQGSWMRHNLEGQRSVRDATHKDETSLPFVFTLLLRVELK